MTNHPHRLKQSTPSETTRPFLKWTGGKQRLLKKIIPHLPQGKRLIEPFLGAGSAFLGTNYLQYVLGDINADLIAVWNALRERPAEFIDRAQALFAAANTDGASYYRIRARFNSLDDRFERAVLIPYLNRFGFNGLFRENGQGAFNVPYGHLSRTPRFPLEEMVAASKKLQHATLHAGGFHPLLAGAKEGDVVYCDPPYAKVVENSFIEYNAAGFSPSDHRVLASAAEQTANRGATVLISNSDTPFTRELYRQCEVVVLTAHRSVAANMHSRGRVSEILAIYRPKTKLNKPRFDKFVLPDRIARDGTSSNQPLFGRSEVRLRPAAPFAPVTGASDQDVCTC